MLRLHEERRSRSCCIFRRNEEMGDARYGSGGSSIRRVVTTESSVPSTSHVEHEHATEPRTAEEPSLLRVAAAVIAYN
ncbi:hypothetical protein HZH68_003135 [Vespula germanica]|uniref:Uncharacterized protein n=1 Tax=Vespula germanica TaxID=30212 RepID=A0A834NNQ3_VESGE|nr:hypothetical protein HZH68_003135 [Vespula germanica]